MSPALVLGIALVLLGVAGWRAWQQGWLPDWLGDGEDHGHTVPLTVTTQPAGAAIVVDGRDRGLTPATLSVAPGSHTVVVTTPDTIPSRHDLTVGAEGEHLAVTLWARRPQITRLRPAYPGASIATTVFDRAGRLVLVIMLPSGHHPI